ncbi:MAG: hypothetical protein HS115_02315 [Spirochaetales bacterium]|nr:hypothetical protein [Spirochaetales bacterium]
MRWIILLTIKFSGQDLFFVKVLPFFLVVNLAMFPGCTTAFEAMWFSEQLDPDLSTENGRECLMISMVLWHDCQRRTKRVNENGQEEISGECQIFFPPIFDSICCSRKEDGCAHMFWN